MALCRADSADKRCDGIFPYMVGATIALQVRTFSIGHLAHLAVGARSSIGKEVLVNFFEVQGLLRAAPHIDLRACGGTSAWVTLTGGTKGVT